ncbi:MAG: hypothetical protein JST68_30570 [Bacteroidetes bacterium]|nr:hypothetical protein [Bacteroidota bacterium]
MKKTLAILSSLLIITGLKAQTPNAQKETVKPAADSLVKKGAAVKSPAAIKEQKEAKLAPASLKYAPATYKAAPANKEIKKAAGQK